MAKYQSCISKGTVLTGSEDIDGGSFGVLLRRSCCDISASKLGVSTREVKMGIFRHVRGPVVLATCLVICSSAGRAVERKPAINLDIAKRMVAACEAKAKQEGWKMNIAVVDAGANLLAFERMDGAYLGSIMIAQHKAITSANFPFSTRGFSELAFGKEGKPGILPGIANFPGIVTFAGGLPIITANNVCRSVGLASAAARPTRMSSAPKPGSMPSRAI